MEMHRWAPICERPSGLVQPVRVDRAGEGGLTRSGAAGTNWHRCAPGLYVPRDRPDCVEQRILEQAGRLPEGAGVTAWAALRWRGANFFDGLTDGGTTRLPVPLVLGGAGANLRSHPACQLTKTQFAPSEREVVAGLPLATVQRALFDEVVRRGSLWPAVQAIEMAAAAQLISVCLFAVYVRHRGPWTGVPLARTAVLLATNDSRSPPETWLRLVWELVARLPRPVCNRPVYDLDGRLLGIPDLFDPVAGLVGEYDGADNLEHERHRADVSREELFRDHGLEYVEVVRGDSRDRAAQRMLSARARAKFLPPESRAWTLQPPRWSPAPESLDDFFIRHNLVDHLTHR